MITKYIPILVEFKSIPKKRRNRTFMEIAGYPHYENVCSNILSFYLDPNAEHQLRNLVLRSLIESSIENYDINFELDHVEVKREFITINSNRIDIFIRTEKYMIGIENKIFHHLHNDLNDYSKTIESNCLNSETPVMIILSLNKITNQEDLSSMTKNGFVNVTYLEFFSKIKKHLGDYIGAGEKIYINHLLDFIKSIENLTPNTMENKKLWQFFKNNLEPIRELTDSFSEYRKFLNDKIYQLQQAVPEKQFAPNSEKQWIYSKNCLVHDYYIGQYFIAIDVISDIDGWVIKIFGRNGDSNNFLFNQMCIQDKFLPKPIENYRDGERLIYKQFDTDVETHIVAESLIDLLRKIESYKAVYNNGS